MPDNIYIGNFNFGLKTNPLPFNIDNDAFPNLFNFFIWRKRAKRKRGTIFLGQLRRQVQIASSPNAWQVASFSLSGGAGNLISQYTLGSSATIAAGTLSLVVGANTYTDANMDGTLQGTPAGSGTINYATGAFTIVGGGAGTVTGTFSYFPGLPVMGCRDLNLPSGNAQYPLSLEFDTVYAYQIPQTAAMNNFYSVSYYKNTNNPVIWTGQDHQLFWTANYSGALWATNNNPGFFNAWVHSCANQTAAVITMVLFNQADNAALTTLNLNDYLYFNEGAGTTWTLNGTSGFISQVYNQVATPGKYDVTFAASQTVNTYTADTAIAQLLTSRVTGTGDGIRWYDGDPTATTGLPVTTATGWVNFAPPLTTASGGVSIDNLAAATYYLVGAQAIVPFKDRLLFFAPWIQTSAGAKAGTAATQLIDTVIWSWNGTPYYCAPTPAGETFSNTAYVVDQTGKGGYLAAGIQQAIKTVIPNEDVLLVGFTGRQTRFVYTSNDISPFLFFTINSEFGASSTFSGITVDRGAYTVGIFGITLTTQESCQRIDIDIPDSLFEIQSLNNGVSRINSARDFYREWLYFSYPVNDSNWKFPTQSFLYNYREQNWAILYENFTAQGLYFQTQNYSWATVPFKTWNQWREPWNSGAASALFPSVIGGTPQGYVLIKGEGTGEGVSGTILAIANSGGGATQITSINHCVTGDNTYTGVGDYVYFQGALGTTTATITGITNAAQAVVTATNTFSAGQVVFISQVAGMTQINGKYVTIVSATGSSFTINTNTTDFSAYTSGGLATISPLTFQVAQVVATPDANTFVVDIPYVNMGYIGQGQFSRLSQPLLQTKQFPFYWNEGRQVRLAAQKYLLDATAASQATVNVYLSQDPNDAWNNPLVEGAPTTALIYSQILYTCPESTNIGLTAANTNLQMPTAPEQYQIWHRYNTSLIGDTFQVGITLSDIQMRNITYATDEITLHGMHLVVEKGPHLA